ncbi:MAG: polysaccharide biosynthesis/export family protein [Chitinophagaceae bacterium]|nr:polysaccharide biosynthesis/export family protein [Oligoflexus sp.]
MKLIGLLVLMMMPLWNACAYRIPAAPASELQATKTFTRQGTFMIGPGDQLDIFVFGEEKLSGRFTISPTGILAFPLLNTLNVTGMSSTQLTKRLETALASYIKVPRVAVSLPSVKSFQVYFSGEVKKIGSLNLTSETNILQALTLAGGLTDFASGRIVLVRQIGNSKVKRYALQYEDILGGEKFVDGITLETGDVIIAE